MTVDPRSALEQLVAALERHYEAASASRDPDHPMVVAAAQDLAEAFDDYDEALYEATEVATPLAIYGDDFDGHEDEDGSEGRVYAGLDSDEYEDDADDDEDDDDLDDEDDEDDEDDDEDDDLDYDDEDDDLDDEDDDDDDDLDYDDEDEDDDEEDDEPRLDGAHGTRPGFSGA
jgi:pyruvate/2-oxoacid:ferredoxin oxidoreductase alpha subunit